MSDNVKSDIVEAWALKLAAEDYQDDIYKKNYQGSRYNWLDKMTDEYEQYLLEKLTEIKSQESAYYDSAVSQYSDNVVYLDNIVMEKYDEAVDKCQCSAKIQITNANSTNHIDYEIVKNTDGEITGKYTYRPKAMLDDKTNASDFINEYKHQFE